jgi:site-specific DNA-methyltransferase (adenine-specific)
MVYNTGMITMMHCDCMEYMETLPDKAFDLAIVDPPYGLGNKLEIGGGGCGFYKLRGAGRWDNAPNEEYFTELLRVSKNQIIWGGNHFPLPLTRGWVFWYKHQPVDNLSHGELAWTSIDRPLRVFDYPWTNVMQGNGAKTEKTIHPTQKPIALYKWLLSRYAKPGDRILDTHGGSGSICIACHDLGFDLTWMEKDEDYYKAACKRYNEHAAQGALFCADEIQEKVYQQAVLV